MDEEEDMAEEACEAHASVRVEGIEGKIRGTGTCPMEPVPTWFGRSSSVTSSTSSPESLRGVTGRKWGGKHRIINGAEDERGRGRLMSILGVE